MNKFILSLSVFLASLWYVVYQNNSIPVVASAEPPIVDVTTPIQLTPKPTSTPKSKPPVAVPKPVSTPVPTPTPVPIPVPAPIPKGQYVDGSYTGPSADAFYGFIQVKAVIQGGKLVDVIFLSYPNDRRTSVDINQQAMPLLKQEAISAQSAHVNGVSGASDSSAAFVESLTGALAQAKNV